MNAYELADINDWSCCAHVKEVSSMLRQQADRIAELHKSAEPVAWTNQKWLDGIAREPQLFQPLFVHGKQTEHNTIPLYTTPQINNKNRSWSDIYDEATAVWDSLNTSNQSNIECARSWFLEGYHQALTRGEE